MDVNDWLGLSTRETPPRLTANQMVQDTLRRAILRGQLAAGSRLVQADIASTLEVSTTPVREALIQLAAEGLIQFDPHRGAVVHEIDLTELREIYEIRTALEEIAVRRAAVRITDDQLDQAAQCIKEMDATDDPATWVERNWQFHFLIEQAAASKRLATVIKTVQNSAILYVAHSVRTNPQRMKEGNKEHAMLLTALRKHDSDDAGKVMTHHLSKTMNLIVREASKD
ncbi:GntR family transcriptional regulator [Jatrophihabitans telluris]|uniref:GntR family transcriptional regulator n=1 Tax=Jatrophihabitans telluris TaxID=2038343 RepID=A0ABY4QZR0_9ACTN|nr:GntR family transcriptional regulator [Jatrophihabitans telluris]UQX88960.1 GntR family transcriptional regulator [Jatrophihabitans telluris]